MAIFLECLGPDGTVLDALIRKYLPRLRAQDSQVWGPELLPSVTVHRRPLYHYRVHCPNLSVATIESILFQTALPHQVTIQLRVAQAAPASPSSPTPPRRRPSRAVPSRRRRMEPPVTTYSLADLLATDPTLALR